MFAFSGVKVKEPFEMVAPSSGPMEILLFGLSAVCSKSLAFLCEATLVIL